jgi:3-oxoacyl-[acyl-carrier-protein] synthase II
VNDAVPATPEVLVAGYGALTCHGWLGERGSDALERGELCFRAPRRFDAAPYRCRFTAESDYVGTELEACCECAAVALARAGLQAKDVGMVLLGTSGDYEAIHEFWRATLHEGREPELQRTMESVPAELARRLAQRLGVRGPSLAFTNGCVAASVALGYGADLIRSGQLDVVLCGGSSLVSEEFFALFDSGRALSRTGALRAFCGERDGLLLGDGVAMVVLESGAHARRRGAEPEIELAGWGMASDGFHVCQPHPEGRGLASAIAQALARAGLAAADIDYVNAHGTGTPFNDKSEALAILHALGPHGRTVPVSSTKTSTGHTLEAAGAVEAVATIAALQRGVVPANAGYRVPDPECALNVITTATPMPLHAALCLNSAFGGLNTAVALCRRGPAPARK